MNTLSGAEFYTHENKGLAEPHGPKALAITSERSAAHNLEICWGIKQWPDWRKSAHDIKAYTVANLDTLLEQFEKNVKAKGITVLWAKDAEEANRYVLNIADEIKAKTVVKAKSMVSEELNLNHALIERGIDVLETDLGEYIVQLAHQRPTHIVTPALHLSAAEVGQLFADKIGVEFTDEHQKLTMIARKVLREKFVNADLGISGVNFGIAETGTLTLIENEGNIGLSTSSPKVHVALMGIEKLLPRLADLPLFLNMLPRMGTGQKLTSYVHMFHGPAPGRKMYLILIDNNRTKITSSPKHRKTLHCIRCGLCLNNCPVYRQVGGWAYGWVYPGPIGSVLTPQLIGMKLAGKLPFACSLCGACSEICPVKVDLAHQMVRL
ncbi:MAG: lactate utilization protein B, partial [Thermoguttaceae bacterium]